MRARPLASCGAPSDALGASSFWRTWRPHAHHFSTDSLFHGLPMFCSVFRSTPKKKQSKKKEKKKDFQSEASEPPSS